MSTKIDRTRIQTKTQSGENVIIEVVKTWRKFKGLLDYEWKETGSTTRRIDTNADITLASAGPPRVFHDPITGDTLTEI